MFFKKKNYNSAEQILKLEQSIEYWKEQCYNLEKCLNFEKKNYRILTEDYKKCFTELENTQQELNKYTMLYHDALSRLRQVMEATNYGKE